MHYVFSGDHGDSVAHAQSMMYPPTTAGFSSTSSDGGDLPLNMHADDSMQADDDMMEDDEEESEADAQMHDGTEQQAADRNRDKSPRDQGKKVRSHSREEAGVTEQVMENTECKKEPNGNGIGEENGLEESECPGESQGHFLKENVFKDSEGIQGKITNQSVAEDEILDNNLDGASDTTPQHNLDSGATIDQSWLVRKQGIFFIMIRSRRKIKMDIRRWYFPCLYFCVLFMCLQTH